MSNGKKTLQDPEVLKRQYERNVYSFIGDERYLRLDDDGRKEKLSEFFDKYTVAFLKRQGVKDTESFRDQFVNKYFQPSKKKEDSTDLSLGSSQYSDPTKKEKPEIQEFSPQSKDKPIAEQHSEMDVFDGVDLDSYGQERPFKELRDIIPVIGIEDIAEQQKIHEAEKEQRDEDYRNRITKNADEIYSSDRFKYIKDNPTGFLTNLKNEKKQIGRELRKKGLTKDDIRNTLGVIEQNATNDFLKKQKERLFQTNTVDEVEADAEELAQPYIADWEEGTFIDPDTGMRVKQPETDSQQDYIDYRDEVIANLGEEKPDADKLKDLHLDKYIKKKYWDARADEAGKQFRGEVPRLGPISKDALEDIRASRSKANAEFEATSLMLYKNIGPTDIEKGKGFNWQVFGNAFAHSLAGEVNMQGLPSIDRDILQKISEVGSEKFEWTDEEKEHVEATFMENFAEISGSLAPDMFMLVAMGQGTNMLKAGSWIDRMKNGYKVLSNPALKNTGKAWKSVVKLKDPVPAGWKVVETFKPTPMMKAKGMVTSALIDEAVFAGVGGFGLGTITGMRAAHGINRIQYKGKWGKILGPYIDAVVKSGFGATVGMEAGAITGMAVESLLKTDADFKEAWDQQWGNLSESTKRVLAEFVTNTVAFGGMHLFTTGSAKKATSPMGNEQWYAHISPKYRRRIVDAAREAEENGYPDVAKSMYDWLDGTNRVNGQEFKEKRLEEARSVVETLPEEHIAKSVESYGELIDVLETKKGQKKFDGRIQWIEGGNKMEVKLADRFELNFALEEAYDNYGIYSQELVNRRTGKTKVQRVEMPEGVVKEPVEKPVEEPAKEPTKIEKVAETIKEFEGKETGYRPLTQSYIDKRFKGETKYDEITDAEIYDFYRDVKKGGMGIGWFPDAEKAFKSMEKAIEAEKDPTKKDFLEREYKIVRAIEEGREPELREPVKKPTGISEEKKTLIEKTLKDRPIREDFEGEPLKALDLRKLPHDEFLKHIDELAEISGVDVDAIKKRLFDYNYFDPENYKARQKGGLYDQHDYNRLIRDLNATLQPKSGADLLLPTGSTHYPASFEQKARWVKEHNELREGANERDKLIIDGAGNTEGKPIRFGALRERGATNEELQKFIGEEFGIWGGGMDSEHKGGKNPKLILNPGKKGEEVIKGKKLLDEIRRTFKIPEYEAKVSDTQTTKGKEPTPPVREPGTTEKEVPEVKEGKKGLIDKFAKKLAESNVPDQVADAKSRGIKVDKGEIMEQQIAVNKNYFKKLAEHIEGKDIEKLKEILHTGNKTSRRFFNEYTGEKLPTTQGGTRKFLDSWGKAEEVKTIEDIPKKWREIVPEIFGEENVPGIAKFVDDIVDLYPFKQYMRDVDGNVRKTIGASKTEKNMFYVIDSDGKIFLEHEGSGHPAKYSEVVEQWGKKAADEALEKNYGMLEPTPEEIEKYKPTQKDIVKEVLKVGEAKHIKDIAKETEILEPNVRRILGVGTKKGEFERVDKGVYKLVTEDGKTHAWIHTGDALDVLPKLAEEGFKADMVFLDIPYTTSAIRSGNRELAFDKISVDQFKKIVENLDKITQDENTPVLFMHSTSKTGMKDMQKYIDVMLEHFNPVAKGFYTKYYRNGNRVTMPMRKDFLPPEAIVLMTKSGEFGPMSKELKLDFDLVRPTGYPTEKPAELMRELIEMTTYEGDMVLDPFAGSGVTGAEAIKKGRKATLVEKSKKAVEEHIKPKLEETEIPEEKVGGEYKYHLNLRPFDIGTYPKEGFLRYEKGGGKYGTVVYEKKLPVREWSRFDLHPETEIQDIVKKTYTDEYHERVEIKALPTAIEVSLFEKAGDKEPVDKVLMSAKDLIEDIESGYFKPIEKPTKKPTGEKLSLVGTVRIDEETRAVQDRRYKVDKHIVEYRDKEGNEYRKSFSVKRGEKPQIPEEGTHKEINALSDQFRETKEKPIEKPTKVPGEEKFSEETFRVPVEDIKIDVKRFQGRRKPFVEQHVKRLIENWIPAKLDPLKLWKDPKTGETWLLAGHNRLEAIRRRIKSGEQKETEVDAKFYEGTEQEAIQFAKESNVGQLAETLTERADNYRKLREKGTSKAEIKRQANKNEGNNAERVIDYSHLDPNGKVHEILERFEETGEGENTENIRNIAQFIGRARRNNPELTDAHESEMTDFLLEGKNYKVYNTLQKFNNLIESQTKAMFFDPKEPLNLGKIKEKAFEEIEYENRLNELKGEMADLQKELKQKKTELDTRYKEQRARLDEGGKLQPGEIELTQPKRLEILEPYDEAIKNKEREIRKFQEQKGKYTEAAKASRTLWDMEIEEAGKEADEAGRKGDTKTQEQLLAEVEKMVTETKEERSARRMKGELGYESSGAAQRSIDDRVRKMEGKGGEDFLVTSRVKKILNDIGVPVAEKYLSKRLLGVYKHRSKNVRVQRLRDVFVAAHEGTHFISDADGIGRRLIADTQKGDPLRKELTDIYVEFYPKAKRSHRLSKRIEEGIAVLIENYAYDPNYIQDTYPNLVKNFIDQYGTYHSPKFTQLLDGINKLVGDYAQLTPEQRIGTRIRHDDLGKVDKGFNRVQRIKFNLFNQVEPLKRYAKVSDITGSTEDPFVHYFTWLNRNSYVYNWIKGQKRSVIRPDGNWDLIPGTMKDVYEMVQGNEKAFDRYLVSRRVVEDHNRLVELKEQFDRMEEIIEEDPSIMETNFREDYEEIKKKMLDLAGVIKRNNIPLSDAAETVRLREKQFEEPVTLYDDIVKSMVDFAENTGLIGSEIAKTYRESKGYAPFFRFIEDELVEANNNIKGTNDSQSKARAFKQRTGSEHDIISPTFGLMTSISEVVTKGLENQLWSKVYQMSLKNPEIAKRFEKIGTVTHVEPDGRISFPQDKDPNLLKVLVGGKRVYVKPAPEFVAVAKNLRGMEWDVWNKAMRIPSSVFTRLTTSANPLWALGNFTVDQISALMQTKTGYLPIKDPIDSFVEIIKTGANQSVRALRKLPAVEKMIEEGKLSENDMSLFKKYLELGGQRQTFKAQFDLTPEEALGKIVQKGKGQKALNIIDSGMSILEYPSNMSEYMSRFAEFKRAKNQGKTDVQAMYMASEVTVPFQLMGNFGGKGGQAWSRSMPYFTALCAIMYKYGRTALEQPGRVVATNAGIIASAITAGAATMAAASDEQKRLLGNLPARELARAIFFPNPWNDKQLIRIRVPEEIGALSGLAYLYTIQHYDGNKVTFDEYIRSLTSAIPDQFNITEPNQMVMSWMPQIVSPTLEAIANKKTYPEFGPIIPQYVLDQAKPEYQYTEYTSKLSKEVGRMLKISPQKVDYWIKNQFGALGRAALMWQLPHNPMIRQEKGHVMGGRSYNHFYENKEELNKEYGSLKLDDDYSVNEKKDLIQDHIVHQNVGRVLSNFRRALKKTQDVPEELKEDIYQLLLKVNRGEKDGKVLKEIEDLNTDVLAFIKDKKINIGVEYKVTQDKIEKSYRDYYKRNGLVEKRSSKYK